MEVTMEVAPRVHGQKGLQKLRVPSQCLLGIKGLIHLIALVLRSSILGLRHLPAAGCLNPCRKTEDKKISLMMFQWEKICRLGCLEIWIHIQKGHAEWQLQQLALRRSNLHH
uniref:Uncharacterized protein n=1 Tax=Opuntia streptacantha TaxID=393608 RepID=A0A7C9ET76_OPUST